MFKGEANFIEKVVILASVLYVPRWCIPSRFLLCFPNRLAGGGGAGVVVLPPP